MTRRELLLRAGAAAAVATLPRLGTASGEEEAAPVGAALDPRLRRVLELAARAPSSHNSQPWAVHPLGESRLLVRSDPGRRLPAVDPDGRELRLSLGCFIECLAQAAPAEGLRAELEPAADGGITVALEPGPVDETGARQVARRRTLRAGHLPNPIAADHLDALLALAGPDARFFQRGSAEGALLAEATVAAMRQQVGRDDAQRELAGWIRFSDREVRAHRDGLTVDAMEVGGLTAFYMRHFMDARSVQSRTFREGGIAQCQRQVTEGAGFLVLQAPSDAAGLLEAGRRFARLTLGLRERSLAAQPMSQALEEAPWRDSLATALGLAGPVQFIVRLGQVERYPDPVSPRRPAAWFLASGADPRDPSATG